MTGLIQGQNAVLSIYKSTFLPFVCASDISMSLESDELPIRAAKGGHWKDFTYNNASYSITLSGLLKFDTVNFTGFDMLDNWFNFTAIKFLITFDDLNGDQKSFQGFAMVKSNTLSYSAGSLVKGDFELTGKGELMYFDGIIACAGSIITITVTGQTAADGIIHVNYTYSGAPYQVKWRVDGTGNYVYALVGIQIDIPGLSVGTHSIKIVPVCLNGYKSDNSASSIFQVTQALTCSAVCVAINTGGSSFNPIFTGTPAQWKYNIDGGAYVYVLAAIQTVSLPGLTVGVHTVNIVPVCANGAEGTGRSATFTVTSNPAQSVINYNFASFSTGNLFQIYVNGILQQSLSASGSGSLIVATGASVRGVLQALNPIGSHGQLQTQDTTLLSVLDNRTGTANTVLQYTFSTNGDTYFIQGTITP